MVGVIGWCFLSARLMIGLFVSDCCLMRSFSLSVLWFWAQEQRCYPIQQQLKLWQRAEQQGRIALTQAVLLLLAGSGSSPRLRSSDLPLPFPCWERGTRRNLMSPYDIQEAFSCTSMRQVTGAVMASSSSRGGIQRSGKSSMGNGIDKRSCVCICCNRAPRKWYIEVPLLD